MGRKEVGDESVPSRTIGKGRRLVLTSSTPLNACTQTEHEKSEFQKTEEDARREKKKERTSQAPRPQLPRVPPPFFQSEARARRNITQGPPWKTELGLVARDGEDVKIKKRDSGVPSAWPC